MDRLFGAAISMVCWFLIMPYEILFEGQTVGGIPLGWVGSKGIFVGIICAFLAVHVYAWADKKGWVIKMPDGVPPTVEKSFAALIPAGMSVPNIISQQFQDLFATFGGAGSTLSLLIAMLLFCRSRRIKELGKLALIPGVFGINEPIIFGLPILLNPMMLIPFMLVPTINIVISYICMSLGLVPLCSGVAIPWTMPVVISGFLATGWQGAVLQVLLLILGVFIYMPFIKMMDKQYLADETKPVEEEDDDDISLDDLSFDDL